MSEYTTIVRWNRGEELFTDNRYSRAHQWEFDGGVTVPASASPQVVPVPLSDPTAVDPEEAFVATLSSCHMLWFLSIAAKRGFVVDSYVDRAIGHMENNEHRRLAITRVFLRPEIRFSGSSLPTLAQIEEMHGEAHHECFIANSVKSAVVVETAGAA